MKQEYIEKLQSWRIWSMVDVEKLSKSQSSARDLMQNYISRGIVSSVRRNMFLANDLATGLPIPGRYEIGSKITNDSYIAYHSAMEYHGIAQQLSFTVQVCSAKKFRPFTFDDYDYKFCASAFEDGIVNPSTDSLVRVTNIERTIVDCADRIDLAGGWEEVIQSFEMIHRPDFRLIESYLQKYNKKALYPKLGLLAEYFSTQWNTPSSFLEKCSAYSKTSLNYFTSKDDSKTYLNRWNIYIPTLMLHYIKSNIDNHEII